MSVHNAMAELAIQAIGERLQAITGSKSSLDDFTSPKGDRGLFGPTSIAWRVHAHFTAMMVGGLSSLIVQALHPRALSAVWDHSDFRNKLKDRLGRTAFFVAATTYGSEAMAKRAIDRVNMIHANIRGIDLEGKPYTANEPDLIRWVHLAEVSSFLSAYQHLSRQPLTHAECDQYISEMARIGHLLGAFDLPLTWASTQAALLGYQDELKYDERAREILKVVENYPTDFFDKPFMHVILNAAFDVMPAWVLPIIEKRPACFVQSQATKLALQIGSEPIQWMLDQRGVSAVARQRIDARHEFVVP